MMSIALVLPSLIGILFEADQGSFSTVLRAKARLSDVD